MLVPQYGHTAQISGMAFSPDGRELATAAVDHTIRLWQVRTGALRAVLGGHGFWGGDLAFSADGRWLVTSGSARQQLLWDARAAEFARSLERAGSIPLAHGPFDRPAYGQGFIQFEHPLNPSERREIRISVPAASDVVLSPDGKRLVIDVSGTSPQLWEVLKGGAQVRLKSELMWPGRWNLQCFAFSPDSQLLVAGGSRGLDLETQAPSGYQLALWDARTGVRRIVRSGPGSAPGRLVFSPDGQTLAGDGIDLGANRVRLWDARTLRQRRTLAGRNLYAPALAFGGRGPVLAAGFQEAMAGFYSDRSLWTVWNTQTGALGKARRIAGEFLSLTPDATAYLTVDWNRGMQLWDAGTGRELWKDEGAMPYDIGCALLSPNRDAVGMIGARNSTGDVGIRGLGSGVASTGLSEDGSGQNLAFSLEGRYLASAGRSRDVRLWEVASGRLARSFPLDADGGEELGAVAFSLDGQVLAAAGGRSIWLFPLATGPGAAAPRKIAIPRRESGSVGTTALAFSPDGALCASGDDVGSLTLWEVASGRPRRSFSVHTGAVLSLAFSATGNSLATAGEDGTLKLSSTRTGRLRATLVVHRPGEQKTPASWLCFTPQGHYDSSAGGTRLIRWRMGERLLPAAAYARVYHRPDLLRTALQEE